MTIDKAPHPSLVIIRGLPGSGKTYLAAALQKSVDEDIVVLDPDSIDQTDAEYTDFSKALTAEGVDLKFHLYRYSRAKAHQGIIDRKIIVWNQPFMDFEGLTKTTHNLEAFAEENDISLPVLIVEVEIDIPVAKARIEERKARGGHGPSDETFKSRFLNIYQSFTGKGYPTTTVSGQDNIEKSISHVLDALQNLQKEA